MIARISGGLPLPGLPFLPSLPLLGGSSCPANETKCGVLDVNLSCEKSCNDTKICVNVCSGLLSNLIGTCICQDGFYRNQSGVCVTLNLCAHATANVPLNLPSLPSVNASSVSLPNCSLANEVNVNCSALDISLACEISCNNTQVCINLCTGLLYQVGQLVNPVAGLIGSLPVPPLTVCACDKGFFRNRNGLCVALDLCFPTVPALPAIPAL